MTQKELILEHLKQGRPISPAQALAEYACFRLAARINELRQAGWPISTSHKAHPKNPKVIYAVYSMKEDGWPT